MYKVCKRGFIKLSLSVVKIVFALLFTYLIEKHFHHESILKHCSQIMFSEFS